MKYKMSFQFFLTLYCNNFRQSCCVVYIDLSSFSFPLLNFFLVIQGVPKVRSSNFMRYNF